MPCLSTRKRTLISGDLKQEDGVEVELHKQTYKKIFYPPFVSLVYVLANCLHFTSLSPNLLVLVLLQKIVISYLKRVNTLSVLTAFLLLPFFFPTRILVRIWKGKKWVYHFSCCPLFVRASGLATKLSVEGSFPILPLSPNPSRYVNVY